MLPGFSGIREVLPESFAVRTCPHSFFVLKPDIRARAAAWLNAL